MEQAYSTQKMSNARGDKEEWKFQHWIEVGQRDGAGWCICSLASSGPSVKPNKTPMC